VTKDTPSIRPPQAVPSALRAEVAPPSSGPHKGSNEKSGLGKDRAQSLPPPAPGWVHVERRFLHASTTHRKPNGDPITPRERLVWFILDGYCGPYRPYCFPGVDRVAADFGVERRTAFEILREMDDDRLVRRVFEEGDRGKLIGFILLRRTNPNFPAPEGEAEIQAMIKLLKEAIEESAARRRTAPFGGGFAARKTTQVACGKPRSDCAENRALDPESLSLEPERLEPEAGNDGFKTPERQRQEAPIEAAAVEDPAAEDLVPELVAPLPVEDLVPELPTAEASAPPAPPRVGLIAALAATFGIASDRPARPRPAHAVVPIEPAIAPAPVAPPPAAAEVAAPPTLAGTRWEKWLADRTPDEWQRVAELPEKDRVLVLEWVQHGVIDDPIIGPELARMLGPKAPIAPPPPVPPPAEMWEQLRGGPPAWIQIATDDLVRDFRDPKFRPAFEALATAVWRGDIEAWKVVDAHRQAMKPESEKPGAMFNHALRNHGILWPGSGA
jgi:hypothetical protein